MRILVDSFRSRSSSSSYWSKIKIQYYVNIRNIPIKVYFLRFIWQLISNVFVLKYSIGSVAQSAYVMLNLFDRLISWWLFYRRGSVIVQSEFDCSVNNSFRNASFWKAVFSASQIWNVLGEISSWLIQPGLLGKLCD